MQKKCTICAGTFEISEQDLAFLRKFDVPPPAQCPDCRHQQRGMFMPALVFHRQFSALSGRPLLSVYSTDSPFSIYSIAEWWSDDWDARDFGRDFQFTGSFFRQFGELFRAVPKMANQNENCENCDYCYSAGNAKNCYYCRTVHRSDDIYYSEMVTGQNSELVDCFRCQRSSSLYECVECLNCHLSNHLIRCTDSRDSHYCYDCQGCSDCLFCANLRNKSYCLFNEPVGRERLLQARQEFINGCPATFAGNSGRFSRVLAAAIRKALHNINCEDCAGDGLANSARCHECYYCYNCLDCRYCWNLTPSKQCVSSMDLTGGGIGELLYNCADPGGGNYYLRMCAHCRQSANLTYCIECYSCQDCFGCTGLRHNRYCILNKQYTRVDYEALLSQVLAHLRANEEWGCFFPAVIAPFAYNHSYASIWFPLTKDQVVAKNWNWADTPDAAAGGDAAVPPLLPVNELDSSICEQIFACTQSGRKFKITKHELAFYRRMNLPAPQLHPDVRMARRRELLNPYRLRNCACSKCGKAIQTTYAGDEQPLCCETCYQSALY